MDIIKVFGPTYILAIVYGIGRVFATAPNFSSATVENITEPEWNLDNMHGEVLEHLLTKISDSCETQKLMFRLILKEAQEKAVFQAESKRRIRELENTTKIHQNIILELHGKVLKFEQKAPVVAFSASVPTHLNNLGPKQVIVFGRVVTNLGEAYDAISGTFRCPVSGLYQFHVGILSKPKDAVETELVVNGQNKLLILASGSDAYNGSVGSNTVILQLHEGDLVWVEIYYSHGGKYVHCCWSTFSGHLLNAS